MALADLVVNLTAETAQFRVAMERAAATSNKSFEKMLGGAKTLGAGIAAYLSADLFVGFIKGQIDAMDQLDEMSQKVGIASDGLSKLAYAAKFSGVDIDGLQTALVKLSKASVEAGKGGDGANEAFKAIGVSVRDSSGQLKSTETLLGDIAEAFSQYEDGASKVAVATAIFGKSGADLIPMLNGGRKGLKDMGDELQSLGGVVMPDAAKKAAEFNDNVDRMTVLFKSLGKGIANDVIPVLNRYMEEIIAAEKAQISFMTKLKLGLTNPFTSAEENAANLRKEITKIEGELKNLGAIDKFFKGKEGREDRLISLKEQLAFYDELIKARKKTAATPDTPSATKQIKFSSEKDNTAADNAKKLSDQIKNLQKEYVALFSTKEEIAVQQARDLRANPIQIGDVKTLTAAIAEQTKIKEDKKKIDEAEKKAQEDTLQLIKSLNDEYLNLTTTTEELALIKAVANNADYKQIEQLLNITDATKKLKEQQEQMQEEDLAAKNAQEDTLRLIKSLNDEYLTLTNTTEELALIRAVANNADYKQIELLLNITDATKKLKEQQQEQMQVEERAAKNAEAALRNLEAARAEHNAMRENENGLLERYIDLINATDNPLQKFQKAQADLLALREDLIAAGYEQGEVDYRISEAIKKQHQQLMSVDEASKNMDQTYKVLGQTMSSAFEDAIMQAKSYQDILNGILTDIARIILRRTLTDPLQQGFENFMGGFSFGGKPTPPTTPATGVGFQTSRARANGGMVNAGTSYLVGERGREIFVPSQNGTIIPNGQGIGSNVAVNVNNYSGQKVETKEVKDSRGNRSITVQIGDAVAQEISRNGSNANMALRTTFNTKPNLVGR
jgi:hypothetical protein